MDKVMEAPEKIYIGFIPSNLGNYKYTTVDKDFPNAIEYIRTDAFLEKALKWYCLDCECNDNCKANHNCFFRDMFKLFLEGNDHALPPKVTSSIKPDGTTKENYRYRHFIRKMQDAFIEKAKKWIEDNGYMYNGECKGDVKAMAEDFVNYMKGE